MKTPKDALFDARYEILNIQPPEIISLFGLNFFEGNILKFISRAPFKKQYKKDLYQAINYIRLSRQNGCSQPAGLVFKGTPNNKILDDYIRQFSEYPEIERALKKYFYSTYKNLEKYLILAIGQKK